MQPAEKGSRVFLAAQAVRADYPGGAKAYSVNHGTLARRLNGQSLRRNITPNSRKLTDVEKSVVVNHVLNLDSRAFPPLLSGVEEEMANRLLASCDSPLAERRQELGLRQARP